MQDTPYDFFIQWHLTDRCNLKCRHCYQQTATAEMSYEQICQGLDDAKAVIKYWVTEYKMKMSPSIHFTGGEPVLSRDLFSVLNYAYCSGFSTSLMSNGTLITKDVAKQIRESHVRDVQISLEGLETVHDSIRGKESFKKALKGINNLVSIGIDTHVNLTISRINFKEVEGLVKLAKELGISAVTFSRLVPCGRGEELYNEMLKAEELADICNNFFGSGINQNVSVISRDPIFNITNIEKETIQADFPVGGCAAGVFGITIVADGGVMPCRRMNLIIGNIRDKPLREIWAESPVLWSLRSRKDYHDGCDTCLYWAMCRGCRAIALAYARSKGKEDFLGPDPQCAYHKPRA